MALTLRRNKGTPLTHAEMDDNLQGLADGTNWSGTLAASVASLTVTTGNLTVSTGNVTVSAGSLTAAVGLSIGIAATASVSGIIFLSRSANAAYVLQTSGTSQSQFRVIGTNQVAITDGTGATNWASFSGGGNGIGAAISSTTNLNLPASTTAVSSIRLAHGSAPSSPVDGDMWTTTSGLFVRINGSTVGPLS